MARRQEIDPSSEIRPALGQLQEDVAVLLAAQRRLTWRTKRAGDAATPDRMRALMCLAAGETTHTELVRRAHLNPASVSKLIEDLELRRLVRRRPDGGDNRVWWISLTAKGRSEVQRVRSVWAEQFEEHLGDFSDREITIASRVMRGLAQVYDSISQVDEPAP